MPHTSFAVYLISYCAAGDSFRSTTPLKTESTETGVLISETLEFERKSTTFFTQSESDVGTIKLPETE